MRAAPAPVASVLVAVLVLGTACSSSDAAGPVHRLAALRALLVTAAEVDLPGYTATPPGGEQQRAGATAVTYFTAPGGYRQLTVTLVATADPAAARAASATALATVVGSLRGTPRAHPFAVGRDGRRIAGRTKGYGALQDTVFFVEGAVAVGVTLSSNTPDRPPDLVTGVARAQDAKLRKAA